MPPKITLPKIKQVDIQGNQNLFDAFDFRYNRALIFHGSYDDRPRVNIDFSYFPDQIIEISLSFVEWGQKPFEPRDFRDLKKLSLERVHIHGTLGEHLTAPNLKQLTVSRVFFYELEGQSSPVFSDTKFLQATPMLEMIKLEHGSIDENFVEGLKSCTLLRTLTISHCEVSRFVLPFLEHLESSGLVPSLGTLEILNQNTCRYMSFEEFGWQFMTKRPNTVLSNYNSEGPVTN
jgi:hypothetical protein